MKKLTLPRNIILSGPYYKFSNPRGNGVTCQRDEWFVSKKLSERQQKTEFQKIFGKSCLGNIVKFRGQREYVISQLYPRKDFPTLQQAINFLIENEGKLVFCS